MFVDKPPSVWQVKVGDSAVEVLNNKCAERYLGRLFSVDNFHEKEIENRIAAGWASFTKFKSELCCKNISLNKRIMLFDSVVTPRVLYGAAAWTLTRTLEKKLLVARRRMLRMIFGYRRYTMESWVEYLVRVTHAIEDHICSLSKDWVYQARLRKWRSAEKLAAAVDGRWNTRLVGWRPCLAKGRHVGRPRTRWEDFFVAMAGGEWLEAARDQGLWRLLEPALKE